MENNKDNIYEMKWGSQTPIRFVDEKYGNLDFNILGTCKYNSSLADDDNLKSQIMSDILSEVNNLVKELNIKNVSDLQNSMPSNLKLKLEGKKSDTFTINEVSVSRINLTDDSNELIKKIQNEQKKVVVQTDVGAKDGQNKCPKCGSTEISLNVNNGMLRCEFCRHEFSPEKISGMVEDISTLEGQVMGSGAQDIVADTTSKYQMVPYRMLFYHLI